MSLKRELTEVEICILAGGQSRRMGQDKSGIRLGRRSLLGHVRQAALETGWPVRVIRKDPVPRCGPLGGFLGALQSSRADAVVFLACDMPLITAELIKRVAGRMRPSQSALFTYHDGKFGFPCVLRSGEVQTIQELLHGGRHSIQYLARQLKAGRFVANRRDALLLRNVNTPEELAALRCDLKRSVE